MVLHSIEIKSLAELENASIHWHTNDISGVIGVAKNGNIMRRDGIYHLTVVCDRDGGNNKSEMQDVNS